MILPVDKFFAVRRDATVPTTVVVITQIAPAAADTATSTSQSSDSTITVRTTITAGSGSSSYILVTSTKTPSLAFLASASASASGLVTSTLLSSSSLSMPSSSSLASTSSASVSSGLPSATNVSSLLATSSSSSTRLGLAIGIPIAVVCIFGLVVFILIFLRKRMDKKPKETLAFKLPKTDPARPVNEKHSVSSIYSSSDAENGYRGYDHTHEQTYGHNTYGQNAYGQKTKEPRTYEPKTYERPPVGAEQPGASAQKHNFLKRMSRLMNMPESPLEFKSPLFLRRFHLSAPKNEGETGAKTEKELPKSPLGKPNAKEFNPVPSIELPTQVSKADFPSRETSATPEKVEPKYIVVKPYVRRLGDELSVGVGQKVSIVTQHSDGWATVKLSDTGDVGVIPLMCVKRFMDKAVS